MKKAAVIIDRPKNCAECELCYKDSQYGTCILLHKIVIDIRSGKSIIDNRSVDLGVHWDCPLISLDHIAPEIERVDELLHFMWAVENPEWMRDTVQGLRDEVIRLRAKERQKEKKLAAGDTERAEING